MRPSRSATLPGGVLRSRRSWSPRCSTGPHLGCPARKRRRCRDEPKCVRLGERSATILCLTTSEQKMVLLLSDKHFRAVSNLPFCYWCGRPFTATDLTDDDHIPPKAIFARADRNPPLKLKAHKSCNRSQSDTDERMGQLLGLLHHKVPRPERQKLRFRISPELNVGGVVNVDIERAVWRYVVGFHAALYKEPFPEPMMGAITVPFVKVVGDNLQDNLLKSQHSLIVRGIKAQRTMGNLDRIQSNNFKLKYECFWVMADDGKWTCMFALDIYGWKELGDTGHYPARGCAGVYVGGTTPPAHASTAIDNTQVILNTFPFDPFAS